MNDNDIITRPMHWSDDLDDLREVMGAIESRYEAKAKLENSRTFQAKAIAFLRDAVTSKLATNGQLDSVSLKSATVADVLSELLKSSTCRGISNIRYYRFTEDAGDGAYVLIDSAGYDTRTENRLRVGELVRFRSFCQQAFTDTFWAHHLNVPVVVSVNHVASSILEPRFYVGCLPLLEVPSDACEETLHGIKSTTWIDFPLTVGGNPVGKLTCDFHGRVASLSEQCDSIVEFWAKSLGAAPFLELIARRKSHFPLTDIVRDIQACGSVGDLLDYCVTTLPRHFDGQNASILTLLTDSLGASKLVLRKTSYDKAKPQENVAAYNIDDVALTAWVARNKRSIRVHNLFEGHEREHQLDQYRVFDSRLAWKNHIPDSETQDSFLAVPIFVDADRVGGVIRLTEKCGENKYFTLQDQTLLEQIAAEAIGRRLASLQATQVLEAITYSGIQRASAMLVSERDPKAADIAAALSDTLLTAFPDRVSMRKLFLLNVLTNDCRHFQHFNAGGTLHNALTTLRTYELKGSLTDHVVRTFLRDAADEVEEIGTTYVVDFQNAILNRAMLPVCENAAVALACPVAFRQKIYGVLVVKSECFDITPEQHGHTLQLIAAHVGMMFAKRDHSCLSRLRARIDKDVVFAGHAKEWLATEERCLSPLEAECPSVSPEPLDLKEVFTEAAADAGCNVDVEPSGSVPVLAHKEALFSVVYNVLKDLCLRQQQGTLHVESMVREKWLEVTIKEFFRSADPLGGEMWEGDIDSVLHEEGHRRLILARKIAYYNEIDNRRATIDRSNGDLVLRFPAG